MNNWGCGFVRAFGMLCVCAGAAFLMCSEPLLTSSTPAWKEDLFRGQSATQAWVTAVSALNSALPSINDGRPQLQTLTLQSSKTPKQLLPEIRRATIGLTDETKLPDFTRTPENWQEIARDLKNSLTAKEDDNAIEYCRLHAYFSLEHHSKTESKSFNAAFWVYVLSQCD